MTAQKVSCPSCRSSLQIQQTLPAKATCPRCSGSFNIAADGATAPLPALTTSATLVNRLPLIGLILGGGFLFLLFGGVLVAVCLLVGRGSQPEADTPVNNDEQPVAKKPKQVVLEPVCFLKLAGPPKTDDPSLWLKKGKPPSAEAAGTHKPICSEAALAETTPEINAAIDRGVEYLKKGMNNQGQFAGDQYGTRVAALVGLTLLSCGVPADDPKLVGIIKRVRDDAPNMMLVYDLSTCIWFLDKLGDPSDRALLQNIALRLMASQTASGGWGDYVCKSLSKEDELELFRVLKEHPYQPLLIGVPGGEKKETPKTSAAPEMATTSFVKGLPVIKFKAGDRVGPGVTDNSLTQFAVLALWTAQKYGVPAQRSLAMVEAHFHQTQNANGTWGYRSPNQWPDSMTCAGLIGLAVGQSLNQPKGAAGGPPDKNLAKDPHIEKALLYLGDRLPKLHLKVNNPELVNANKEIASLQAKIKTAKPDELANLKKLLLEAKKIRLKLLQQQKSQATVVNAHGELYFLWSLERVAVIYGLHTIGGTNWHEWGADQLVPNQQGDGSWRNVHGAAADTCFALLFLKRVNVATDLTKLLKDLGGARDPGAPPGTPTGSHLPNVSQSEIKDEPDTAGGAAPGRVKTRTGYKTPAKT